MAEFHGASGSCNSGAVRGVTKLRAMTFRNRLSRLASVGGLLALVPLSEALAQVSVPIYSYKVVHTYPHDTQGLHRGALLS